MSGWWADDKRMISRWWADDERMMSRWQADDEQMMSRWWADDERMMSEWWADDEQMISRWWADDERMMSWWWADDERMMSGWWTDFFFSFDILLAKASRWQQAAAELHIFLMMSQSIAEDWTWKMCTFQPRNLPQTCKYFTPSSYLG